MVRDTECMTVTENPRGGCGSIELHPILNEEQMLGQLSLFARVVLRPKTAIGLHRHQGETEAYYVTAGSGFFLDDDGSRTEVFPGDICTIEPGQCHGMENPGDFPMELIALVIPENSRRSKL